MKTNQKTTRVHSSGQNLGLIKLFQKVIRFESEEMDQWLISNLSLTLEATTFAWLPNYMWHEVGYVYPRDYSGLQTIGLSTTVQYNREREREGGRVGDPLGYIQTSKPFMKPCLK